MPTTSRSWRLRKSSRNPPPTMFRDLPLYGRFPLRAGNARTILRARQRKRESGLERAEEVVSDTPSAESQLLHQALLATLQEAMMGLTDGERATLQLAFESDQLAGPQDAALRKRKQRTLERLRLLWRQIYGT
jgi:hypothetical protein